VRTSIFNLRFESVVNSEGYQAHYHDRDGKIQPGREYRFEDGTVIREDSAGHEYPDDPIQNRGPHFNDPSGNHYDY
jgi:hypothetical protein